MYTCNCNNFLTYLFKHVFLMLKRTVSLRLFFEHPQQMFWLRNKKKKFLYTILSGGLDIAYNSYCQNIIPSLKIVSEYDQEIPQSQTSDNSMAP